MEALVAQGLALGTEQRLAALVERGLAQRVAAQRSRLRRYADKWGARLENRLLQAVLLNRIKRSFPLLDNPGEVNALLQSYRNDYRAGKRGTLVLSSQPARALPPASDAPVEAYWLTRPSAKRGVLLYTAGGGFILPPNQRQVACAEQLGQMADCDTLLNCHRMAPEHPFPLPVQDTVSLYCWLLQRYKPEQIVLAADTAGAAVSLGALLQLRQQGLPQPAGIILFSPWVDLSLSGWSYITKSATADSPFRMETAAFCARAYLQQTVATDALASPAFADLAQLPPLAIHTSRYDMHFDDALRLVENANAAGVAAEVKYWDSPRHHLERFNSAEARRSLQMAAGFLTRRLP